MFRGFIIYIMKLLICLVLIMAPVISRAQISFVAAQVEKSDLFRYKNDALLRQALLKANGKDWFIKNIILSDPKQLPFYLNFIAGGYCAAGEVYPDRSGKRDEFFIGLKKAIALLSNEKETLYFFYTVPKIDWNLPFKGNIYINKTSKKNSYKLKYDYDKFFYPTLKRKNVDYISLFFDGDFNPRICLDLEDAALKKKLYSKEIDNLTEKYKYKYNFYRIYTEPYKMIDNANDAEDLFKAIKAFDDYVLSLSPNGRIKMKLLPWSYLANIQHWPCFLLEQLE